jgi:hypothetical protein
VPDDWELSDDEIDSWLEEWEAVDRAAAAYLAQRIPGVQDISAEDRGRWVDQFAETISPSEDPGEEEIEDREGHLAVLELALLHLTPLWQGLGVLDQAGRFTERGVWGLPKALYRNWSDTP